MTEVIAVLGASGGLGASTLAAALARRAADRGAAPVLVDADLLGGGLDVTVGAEHLAGLRWPDLAELRGAVDGPALLRELPLDHGVRLLSAGRSRPGGVVPDAPTRLAVHGALAELAPVIVDVPRADPVRDALLARCDHVLLVSGLRSRALADVDALVAVLLDAVWPAGAEPIHGPALHLVTRGPAGGDDLAEAVEEHLGAAHLVHIPDDDRVARAAERGDWPGQRRTRLAAAADVILDETGAADLGLVS